MDQTKITDQNKSSGEKYWDYLVALGFAFFTTVSSLIYVIVPVALFRNVLALLLLFAVFIKIIRVPVNLKTFLFVFAMFAITLPNNYYLQKFNLVSSNSIVYITFVAVLFCFWLSRKNLSWISLFLKFTKLICLFYAFMTIILKFTPHIYTNYVVRLFPHNRERLIKWYNHGWMPGLTNHYSTNAMLIAVGTLIVFAECLLNKENRKDRNKNYLYFFVFIIALLLTGKRAHLLFVLLSGLLLYYFASSKKLELRWFKILIALVLLVAVIIVIYKFVPSLSVVLVRLQESLGSDDITNNRTRWWKVAVEYFKKYPVLGIGWGQFFDLCEKETGYAAYTHNVYLQLLCETGIVGFAIYFSWMVVSFFKTLGFFKWYRNHKEIFGGKIYAMIGFSLCYQAFFLMYCFTGNPLYDKETFIPYFISCIIYLKYRNLRKINVELSSDSDSDEQDG